MGWVLRVVLGVIFAALALTSVQAEALPKDGMTVQEIGEWLTAAGFKTEVHAASSGVVFMVGDQKLVAFLGDCSNDRCQSVQYYYGIHYKSGMAADDGAAALITNTWNRDHRWTRAYIDKERDPCLEMDVSLVSGVDSDGLNRSLRLFLASATEFKASLP